MLTFVVSIRRPSSKDFFIGRNCARIKRIELKGQKRMAIINERNAVSYLCKLERRDPKPSTVTLTNIVSYDATLYDRWGAFGTISIGVSTEKNMLRLVYATMDEENYAYLILDENAPMPVCEVVDFLVSTNAGGKLWVAGKIEPWTSR
jgi:hypothetical protein